MESHLHERGREAHREADALTACSRPALDRSSAECRAGEEGAQRSQFSCR